MAKTQKKLADFDSATVAEGTEIWLKGSGATELDPFLDGLAGRGLDLFYAGPGDRYKVIRSGSLVLASCANNLGARLDSRLRCASPRHDNRTLPNRRRGQRSR